MSGLRSAITICMPQQTPLPKIPEVGVQLPEWQVTLHLSPFTIIFSFSQFRAMTNFNIEIPEVGVKLPQSVAGNIALVCKTVCRPTSVGKQLHTLPSQPA